MKKDKDFQIFLKSLGENIKEHRIDANMTQESLADLVEYKYYQKIESGQINITVKTLYKICKKLNAHPKDLFNFKIK